MITSKNQIGESTLKDQHHKATWHENEETGSSPGRINLEIAFIEK